MAAVQKGLKSHFVVQSTNGWSVRPAANPEQAVVFNSRAEALRQAKLHAKATQGEIFVFDQDGALIGRERA